MHKDDIAYARELIEQNKITTPYGEGLATPYSMLKEVINELEYYQNMTHKSTEALPFLLEVKHYKDTHGKDDWYYENQPKAWKQAELAVL